jgi:hypothetical protein
MIGDVGVVERGEGCRLALEAGEELGVPRHVGGQDLDHGWSPAIARTSFAVRLVALRLSVSSAWR